MLQVIEVKGAKFVRLAEFYDHVDLNKETYHRFVKKKLTSNKIASKGIDYLPIQTKNNGTGRPRTDYLISLNFLKTLCFEVESVKSKHLKDWSDNFVDFRLI